MDNSNQPNHEIRLGKIRATIWENRREGEDAWYRVTTSRLYKEGSQWRNTQSFRPDDLPVLGKVLDLAHDWLLGQELSKESRERDEQPRGSRNGTANKKGGKPNGSRKQGQRNQVGGERALMRQSTGNRVDSTRGSRSSGASSPLQARNQSK